MEIMDPKSFEWPPVTFPLFSFAVGQAIPWAASWLLSPLYFGVPYPLQVAGAGGETRHLGDRSVLSSATGQGIIQARGLPQEA